MGRWRPDWLVERGHCNPHRGRHIANLFARGQLETVTTEVTARYIYKVERNGKVVAGF